jgi:hypothetical protein
LFANLAFFAWAAWIDTPVRAAPVPAARKLPPLVLASDAEVAAAQSNGGAGQGGMPASGGANCVSVGPFDSEELVGSALAALRERGYNPRPREEEGERFDGYWVYVADLKSDLDQARVMRTLIQAQLRDARIMPLSRDEGRRISVGVFSDRGRAERRQRLVRRLGIQAQLGERKSPVTVFWLDLNQRPGAPPIATEGLLPADAPASPLEVHPCAAS